MFGSGSVTSRGASEVEQAPNQTASQKTEAARPKRDTLKPEAAMFEFMLDTYETERLKTVSVWSEFADADLGFRPAPLARTPREHMVHQCLSEHNWMLNMLGIDPGRPALPSDETRVRFLEHYAEVSAIRLQLLRAKPDEWFNEPATFFDKSRPRCWILLRRLTHSAHHRAQLTVYLRLLGKPLYS